MMVVDVVRKGCTAPSHPSPTARETAEEIPVSVQRGELGFYCPGLCWTTNQDTRYMAGSQFNRPIVAAIRNEYHNLGNRPLIVADLSLGVGGCALGVLHDARDMVRHYIGYDTNPVRVEVATKNAELMQTAYLNSKSRGDGGGGPTPQTDSGLQWEFHCTNSVGLSLNPKTSLATRVDVAILDPKWDETRSRTLTFGGVDIGDVLTPFNAFVVLLPGWFDASKFITRLGRAECRVFTAGKHLVLYCPSSNPKNPERTSGSQNPMETPPRDGYSTSGFRGAAPASTGKMRGGAPLTPNTNLKRSKNGHTSP